MQIYNTFLLSGVNENFKSCRNLSLLTSLFTHKIQIEYQTGDLNYPFFHFLNIIFKIQTYFLIINPTNQILMKLYFYYSYNFYNRYNNNYKVIVWHLLLVFKEAFHINDIYFYLLISNFLICITDLLLKIIIDVLQLHNIQYKDQQFHLIDTQFNYLKYLFFINFTKILIVDHTVNLLQFSLSLYEIKFITKNEMHLKKSPQHIIQLIVNLMIKILLKNRILIRILTVFIEQTKGSYSINQIKQHLVLIIKKQPKVLAYLSFLNFVCFNIRCINKIDYQNLHIISEQLVSI
ncbi:unnamed protein product (macronuclear) [Paramecium tetraurelia]|uniref:Transmembrane protein n=1 Tax=Paramecium tetraurelia TaxID=5888 RepID=A0E5H5_PARTE|nr:uncharacterized protein GSPATT00003403001 [Paramecium tetraurelia]CAK90542.1 unnamed protein product [Paramecium tetraurelia]|eukprot:XP_001457939.1 hypothetical protein (macronuclear) [Paramecium tetraurelia strain d4-2]